MKKILKSSWRYIRRSPYQALAAVAIMTLTLFVSAVFVLVGAGSEKILSYFEKRPQVIAFLEDDVSKEGVDELTLKLLSTGKVSEVVYVSKEEALKIYQDQNENDPLLLEMVTAEILPASLEISTKEIVDLGEIASLLNDQPGIEEVDFQEDVVEALQKIIQTTRQGGLVLISFLGLVSFLVVLVIIGMKAAIRRREVRIMKLIGATPWYIRAPFLLEGVFYGVVSAFLAWVAAYTLLLYSTPFLINFLTGIPLLPVPIPFMLLLLAGLIGGGGLIGGLGGLIAVRRYLR
jgi:cell division transport system permease protein